MKRILIISNLFPPHVVGGAEIVAYRQARALRANGHDVAVFAGRYSQPGDIDGALNVETEEGFPVYRLVNPAPNNPSWNFWRPADGRRLASVLAVFKPEIVHFHNVVGLGVNMIPLARGRGCRVIVTLHDYWGVCFKNTLIRNNGAICDNVEECAVCQAAVDVEGGRQVPIRLRRDFVAWCLNSADLLLSPSRYLQSRIQDSGLVDKPIEVLSNGIPERSRPERGRVSKKVVQFACFSYIGEHKGIPTLVRAAELLAENDHLRGRWRLVLAGHGHLAKWVARTIASDHLDGAVQYVGRLPHEEAQRLQADSDVVVLASEWPENEPVTLLEAIQSGKAQIASRIGGNVDLVDEGKSGFMFEPGNARSLAEAMRRLIETPSLADDFGQYNACRREQFDERKTIASLEAIYNDLEPLQQSKDVVVICAGQVDSAAFMNRINLLLARFYRVEDAPGAIRFIWHEWANSEIWQAARLLWIWGDGDGSQQDLPLVRRALRAGIGCLLPATSQLSALASDKTNVAAYGSLLEALGHIAALQDPVAAETPLDTRRISRAVTALSPLPSFAYTLPR